MPLVYELDDDLKPLNRYASGDPEKVKAAMDAVAAQGKKKVVDAPSRPRLRSEPRPQGAVPGVTAS